MNTEIKNVIVIKMGGSIIQSKDSTVQDVIELQKSGRQVVLVHGGASMVTKWLAEQGVNGAVFAPFLAMPSVLGRIGLGSALHDPGLVPEEPAGAVGGAAGEIKEGPTGTGLLPRSSAELQ